MYRRVSTGFFIFKYRIFYWIKQILYKVIENFLSVFEKGYPKNKKYTRWSNKWTYEVEIVADVTSFHRMFRRHRKFTLYCLKLYRGNKIIFEFIPFKSLSQSLSLCIKTCGFWLFLHFIHSHLYGRPSCLVFSTSCGILFVQLEDSFFGLVFSQIYLFSEFGNFRQI